ncbi:hypothetical protein C8C77_11816 [Halanaerobium saccharolyticum]|uniref:CsbD-like domain-containing protein n=2 Tax=Halanaerobium saccharolyticum TaxID=43595 RepID=A0A4R7YWV8_9FIRM|nr:hypothetical protein C7958_11744 [Halanaerobium saccharolyticum]TDW01860.1 hypothetical protein C8C77_11816 [Halanaerobium saccharolyticum]TDX53106.1 hypothetical protein C7956_11816 [Halanaerobium saccharolyticum]
MMDKNDLKLQWKELKDKVQNQWDKISEQDFSEIKGDKDKLIETVQEKYNKTKEKAKKEVDSWLDNL